MLAEPVIDVRRVKIECPTCCKEQYVKLRVENLVAKNGVISLVIKAACDHEFNLYLDCHFQVRGYERIDAVVSAEMLQVDQEISDFMKGEGIKENTSCRFIGKFRNDIDRDRHLETIIRYFRGADATDAYWVAGIGGRRVEPAKFEPAKAFPLPPLPSFPVPPAAGTPTITGSPLPAAPKTVPDPGTSPAPTLAAALPPPPGLSPVVAPKAIKAHDTKAKLELKGLPPIKAKAPAVPAPEPEPVAMVVEPAKIEATPEFTIETEVAPVTDLPAEAVTGEAQPEAEAVAAPEPAEAPEVPEITMDDLRSQFDARIKKINDLMIKLELDNLNETVSDVVLVKKKAKLCKIKDDLEAQFNRIVAERGLDKAASAKVAAGMA